jgi:hypothetical protein
MNSCASTWRTATPTSAIWWDGWLKALPISSWSPDIDQANLMASAIASLGQAYLEKTGAIEIGRSDARH